MTFGERIRLFLRRQREGVRFCVLFALYTVAAFGLLYAVQNVVIVPLNRHLAWMTEHLLRLFGARVTSMGGVVAIGAFAVEIKNNCNAIYEIGLYAAAVWAYPVSLRDRLAGTFVGAAVLYAVNILRILTLLALGVFQPAWFQSTHLYAWQALFLLVVATCWLAWVSRVRPVA
jgi:exosortase H (IPTLxxWG-CTERM-specific)